MPVFPLAAHCRIYWVFAVAISAVVSIGVAIAVDVIVVAEAAVRPPCRAPPPFRRPPALARRLGAVTRGQKPEMTSGAVKNGGRDLTFWAPAV